jgi:hypothetical protein
MVLVNITGLGKVIMTASQNGLYERSNLVDSLFLSKAKD